MSNDDSPPVRATCGYAAIDQAGADLTRLSISMPNGQLDGCRTCWVAHSSRNSLSLACTWAVKASLGIASTVTSVAPEATTGTLCTGALSRDESCETS